MVNQLGVMSVMILWILVHVITSIAVFLLIYKVIKLIRFIDERAKVAAKNSLEAMEDRKIAKELLTTIKGWAITVEAKENHKEKKMEQVAETAAKTAVEVKQAIAEAVNTVTECTANKVVELLDKKSASDSTMNILKTQPQ